MFFSLHSVCWSWTRRCSAFSCGGAVLLSRWYYVLKAAVQVRVMSWQDVASKVAHLIRVCVCVCVSVCVLVSPTDVASALVITAVTSVAPRWAGMCKNLYWGFHTLKKSLCVCVCRRACVATSWLHTLVCFSELCVLKNKTFTIFCSWIAPWGDKKTSNSLFSLLRPADTHTHTHTHTHTRICCCHEYLQLEVGSLILL